MAAWTDVRQEGLRQGGLRQGRARSRHQLPLPCASLRAV